VRPGLVSCLVRHGETAHSVARRTSGLGDVPLTWERDPVSSTPAGGESVAATIARVQRPWSQLRSHLSGTVVIVGHATPLQSLLGLAAAGELRCATRFQLAIGSVTRVDVDREHRA
jgi:broad specificity phosphatase PhoE